MEIQSHPIPQSHSAIALTCYSIVAHICALLDQLVGAFGDSSWLTGVDVLQAHWGLILLVDIVPNIDHKPILAFAYYQCWQKETLSFADLQDIFRRVQMKQWNDGINKLLHLQMTNINVNGWLNDDIRNYYQISVLLHLQMSITTSLGRGCNVQFSQIISLNFVTFIIRY